MTIKTGPLPTGIVMFSPMPPQPNGIADYCYELLGPLSRHLRCTVVVQDMQGPVQAPAGVEMLHLVDYCARADGFADTLHVYQLGNNPDHLFMLPIMAARPGLAVLHDPALHHLLDVSTVGPGDLDAYSDALEADYGQPGRLLGTQFQTFRLRDQRMYFDLPMLRNLLGPQLGVIVHSRFAASKVLTQLPDAPIDIIPHHYSPPADEQIRPAEQVRDTLGIGPDEIVFMSLGFATRSKMIDAALRALALVRRELPPFRYVIAGELRPEEIDVRGLATSLGLGDQVITPGYVEEAAFFSLIGAADIVINLRNPVGGETSGTMIRSLGAGACLVVVARGAFAEIPDGAAIKLPPGPGFDHRLAEALLRLARNRTLRLRIGALARQTISARNSPQTTVSGYCAAIARAAARCPPRWSTRALWEYRPARAAAKLLHRIAPGSATPLPLWLRIGAVPSSATPCRLARFGNDWPDAHVLAQGLGQDIPQPEPLGPIHGRATPAEPRAIDLLLISTSVHELVHAPSDLLRHWNRMLTFGGAVVLNIVRHVQDDRRHAFEDRAHGQSLFEAAGFRVELCTGVAPPMLDHDGHGPGETEERCWRAIKVSEFQTAAIRHPATIEASPSRHVLVTT